ncbi:MAG TPA: glycosyltransferase [Actinomycetota bacterium]|nr:glycosyltransferase [Actinomycetota bacterium]
MRVLIWHGWLLEGSGSNVNTARVAEALRAAGHDVLLLCQETNVERYPWIDEWGTVGRHGPSEMTPSETTPAAGRCVLLRPRIGRLLPVFVIDEYAGFDVKRFVDLADDELESYLDLNVEALRAAAAWHRTEAVIAGHAIPGATVAARAVGLGRFMVKIHGSDIEYAIREQERYRRLGREGLVAARTVSGPSADVLDRCAALIPEMAHLARVIRPGVDSNAFRPMPRRDALLQVAAKLERDPDTSRGRPASLDAAVEAALSQRNLPAIEELAATYDHDVPDPDGANRLRELAAFDGPLIGYFGKLIPQKGVELALAGAHLSTSKPAVLVVGFGSHREQLTALTIALRKGDVDAFEWLRRTTGTPIDLSAEQIRGDGGGSVTFTGRLDHRYAPAALAAMDVLVVPSILLEAFGMVSAEGAAAGALPLVAGHSGLAEVAAALEEAVERPGLFSFAPGEGATRRVADGIDRLLELDPAERERIRQGIHSFVAENWSWRTMAEQLLRAATA